MSENLTSKNKHLNSREEALDNMRAHNHKWGISTDFTYISGPQSTSEAEVEKLEDVLPTVHKRSGNIFEEELKKELSEVGTDGFRKIAEENSIELYNIVTGNFESRYNTIQEEKPILEQRGISHHLTLDSPTPTLKPISHCADNTKDSCVVPEENFIELDNTTKMIRFNVEQNKSEDADVLIIENAKEKEENADLTAFAKYVDSRIRKLKDPHLQVIAKLRIISQLLEIEME